jgi:hypothetical protein
MGCLQMICTPPNVDAFEHSARSKPDITCCCGKSAKELARQQQMYGRSKQGRRHTWEVAELATAAKLLANSLSLKSNFPDLLRSVLFVQNSPVMMVHLFCA